MALDLRGPRGTGSNHLLPRLQVGLFALPPLRSVDCNCFLRRCSVPRPLESKASARQSGGASHDRQRTLHGPTRDTACCGWRTVSAAGPDPPGVREFIVAPMALAFLVPLALSFQK